MAVDQRITQIILTLPEGRGSTLDQEQTGWSVWDGRNKPN